MSIKPIFAWYDMWIGAFWDGGKRRLYILPLPCIGVVIQFSPPEPKVNPYSLADGLEILRTDIRLADTFIAEHTGRHEALVNDRRKRAVGFRAILAALGEGE